MNNISKKTIEKINTETAKRYNKRLFAKGVGAYALGWNKEKYQEKRFFDLLHAIEPSDLNNKRVLDIGCGLGDFYKFLKKQNIKVKKYIGTDINDNFIKIAKKRYPECSFSVRDFMIRPCARPIADTAISLGVINFKQKNHDKYAQEYIKSSFKTVSNTLVINAISLVYNKDYPAESFINYFDPAKILHFAQEITPFCSLVQDYAAEPQYEFMLVMRKKPWKNLK